MNPADKRLNDLLDKWQASLELHLKYATLDEQTYRKVQPWPPHDRPSRWIVELGLQKIKQLKEQHGSRIAMGDAKFADALELMGFLSNLVGSQHIQRFIPLAEPQSEADIGSISATVEHPRVSDSTREMPRPKIAAHPLPAKTAARRETKAHKAEKTAEKSEKTVEKTVEKMIIADAVRLLRWGRKWHELAELIARIADRPSLAEVRRILREQKPAIERQRNKE